MAKTVFGIPGVNDKSSEGSPVAPGGTGPSPATVTPAKAAPMANPVTAKPVPASTAAPAATQGGAAKTVFGMPAVKLPTGAPAPAPAPASASSTAAAPAAAAPKGDDAFGATMIGAPAMTQDNIQASVEAAREATRSAADSKMTTDSSPAAMEKSESAPTPGVQDNLTQQSSDAAEWQPPPEPSNGFVIGLIVGLVCIIGAILLAATSL
jgi:hypothetical protein